MNTQELIQRYKIALKLDERGQPTGNLIVYRADKAALAAIKAAKPEIVAALLAQREAGLRAEQERQAKIDAIPGLREIEAARADLVNWKLEFDASFDSENGGGVGVRSKPKYDMDALYAKYPRAKAYLDAQDFAASEKRCKIRSRHESAGSDHQRRKPRTGHRNHEQRVGGLLRIPPLGLTPNSRPPIDTRTPRPRLTNKTTCRTWARFPFLREQRTSKISQRMEGRTKL